VATGRDASRTFVLSNLHIVSSLHKKGGSDGSPWSVGKDDRLELPSQVELLEFEFELELLLEFEELFELEFEELLELEFDELFELELLELFELVLLEEFDELLELEFELLLLELFDRVRWARVRA
jgi:hypothetical protein